MSSTSVRTLSIICMRFGTNYQRCRQYARSLRELAWEITPTVHKVMHLPMLSQCFNPRRISCYPDESLIGTT
eukprot:8160379-Pyramimonas_sp.AAC.1